MKQEDEVQAEVIEGFFEDYAVLEGENTALRQQLEAHEIASQGRSRRTTPGIRVWIALNPAVWGVLTLVQ